jgi:hypothetical protein
VRYLKGGGKTMGIEMMTIEQLSVEVETWLEKYKAEMGAMDNLTPNDKIFIGETIDTSMVLLDRLKKNQFMPMQTICVMSLQAIMQGPEFISRMLQVFDAVGSGQCIVVPTANMQALMGAPAGRA